MRGTSDQPVPFKFYKDSPRQLMSPGYIDKESEEAPYMKTTIKAFPIPVVEDSKYWDEIANLINTNSLCGLNDMIPCLRSQKLKIPYQPDRVTYNTFDEKVNVVFSNILIDTNARYWESSLIDSINNYADHKYGELVKGDPKQEVERGKYKSQQLNHYLY